MNRHHPIEPVLKHLFLILGALALFAFLAFMLWGDSGLKKLWGLKQKKETIAQENQKLIKENWLLLEEIKRLNDPKFLEQRARSEMGMVRKNETVYVIEENPKP